VFLSAKAECNEYLKLLKHTIIEYKKHFKSKVIVDTELLVLANLE